MENEKYIESNTPFLLGDYSFETYQSQQSENLTMFFVILTDPDGQQHLGSSIVGQVDAVMDADLQCLMASGYKVDVFELEQIARSMEIEGRIRFSESSIEKPFQSSNRNLKSATIDHESEATHGVRDNRA